MKFFIRRLLIAAVILYSGLVLNGINGVQAQTQPECEAMGRTWDLGTATCAPAPAASTPASTASGASTNNSKDLCSDTSWWSGSAPACYIWLMFTYIVLGFTSTLFYIGTNIFDYALSNFILNISTLFKNGATDKEGIYIAWTVIRDISNIAIFFGSMYIGVRYIIGAEQLDFRKAITKIILYALLVNFSFPISKFLIDASNLVSLFASKSIINGGHYMGIQAQPDGVISRIFMDKLGFSWFVSQAGESKPASSTSFGSFSVMWMTVLFATIGAFVFLYAGILIMIRAVILIICVIASPFMFISGFFPKLDELNLKWRENFFGQLMFGPVVIIGLWITLIIINVGTTGEGSIAGLQSVGTGNIGDYSAHSITLLFALIALIATVKLAVAISGSAGKAMGGMIGGTMKGAGLALATGGTGFAFRNTAGRLGAKVASSQWVKNTTKDSSASRRMTTSLMSRAGERLANGNLFGRDSFAEKNYAKISKTKTQYQSEHGEQLKSLGLTDFLTQVKSKEDLQKFEEELANRRKNKSDKSKWNEDVLSKADEKRRVDLYQDATRSNVSMGKRGQYIDKVNALKELEEAPLELQRINPTRADRLKIVEEGRNKQIEASQLKTEAKVKSKEEQLNEIENELVSLDQQKINIKGTVNEKSALASIDQDIESAQAIKSNILKDIAESQVQNAVVTGNAVRSLQGNAVRINNLNETVTANENAVTERKAEIQNTKQGIEDLKNTNLASKFRAALGSKNTNSNTTQTNQNTNTTTTSATPSATSNSTSSVTPNPQAPSSTTTA